MMSIRTMAISGLDLTRAIASFPVVAVSTFMPRRSSTLLSAKMLRASSSTSSAVLPIRSSSELLSFSSIRCFSIGSSVITRCRNSEVSSSRRSGDSTPFTTMLRAMVWSSASSSADSSRPVKTTTGTLARPSSLRIRSRTSNPVMSGSRRSSTTQSQGFSRRTESAPAPVSVLRENPCDCVVLDLRLPDMTGFEVLDRIRNDDGLANVPVEVFTGRELSAEEDAELHTMARSIVVKGVESPERLLDETSLFLHRVITELPAEKQRMLEKLNSSDDDLVGKTALLVDDDARNIFALSSVLERRGMKVLTATTGGEAIALVGSNPDIAIVLMDIMMPQMDGYQTIGVIRQDPLRTRLPIIALTAKAMKGDREKCLEAGASDYLAKPVNTEQLLLAIRMWLHR